MLAEPWAVTRHDGNSPFAFISPPSTPPPNTYFHVDFRVQASIRSSCTSVASQFSLCHICSLSCLPLVIVYYNHRINHGFRWCQSDSLLQSSPSKFCLTIFLAFESHFLDPLFHCILSVFLKSVTKYYILFLVGGLGSFYRPLFSFDFPVLLYMSSGANRAYLYFSGAILPARKLSICI